MTVTLGAGQGPVGPGAGVTSSPAPVQNQDLAHGLTATTNSAPELKTDPATAVAVASGGGDVGLKARAVAQGKDHVATAEAAQGMHAGGFLGDIGSDLDHFGSSALSDGKSLAGGAMHLMNVPLRTVQQEYRYLHDVEALHGRTAALEEGLGLVLGAAAGTAIDPGEGTILGADAAGWIEGHTAYKNSWQRAANPNYRDPHTGQLVSFGRDVADVLGARTGGFHAGLSGALDAMFDLGVDPVANVGKIKTAAYSGTGAGGLLGTIFSGTSTATAEDVERASMLPRIKMAFADIANSDAGTIAIRYPGLATISKTLEADTTADEVKQTFMELAGSMEMMEQPTLPTLSLAHYFGRSLRDSARNAGGPLGYLPRSIADALESQPGNTLSTSSMDFMHGKISMTNARGAKDLYRFFRFGQGDRVARATVDAFVHGTPGERYAILKNGMYSTILAMAKMTSPDYPDLGDYMEELELPEVKDRVMESFQNTLQAAMTEGGDPGKIYGLDEFGNVIKGPVMGDGSEIAAGITSGQTGDVSLPNLVEMRRMAQAVRSTKVRRVLARADDAFNDYFTQTIFKPLELMSGAYALHIAGAEIIPNVLRDGVVATTRGMAARALASVGYDESENIDDAAAQAGWLWRLGGSRLLRNDADAEALLKSRALTGGAVTPAGLSAGHITTGETQGVARAENGLKQIAAVPGYHSDDWAQFSEGDKRFAELHRASFRRAANDRWSRTAAGAYLGAAMGQTVENLPDEIPPSLFRHRPQGSSTLSALTSGPLYRESSAQDALDTVSGQSAGLSGPVRKYWSNDRDLALGQGESRGVVVEKEGSHLHGDVDMRKPGAEFQASEGRAEFQAAHWRGGSEGQLGGGGIRSVEIKPEALAHQPYTQDERMSGFQKPPDRQFSNMESNAVGSLRRQLDRAGYRKFGLSNGGERWVRSDLTAKSSRPASAAEGTIIARDAVADALRQESPEVLENFARNFGKRPGAPGAWDNITDWADAVVSRMKGVLHGKPDLQNHVAGPLNMDLLHSLANGHTPEQSYFDELESADRPLRVEGQIILPSGYRLVNKIATKGFGVINPMVNAISRNQEYTVEYLKQYHDLQKAVDNGTITDDERVVMSTYRSVQHGVRFVHNLTDRTQWTTTLRNWAPFFFAQEQAYRRMGRFLVEDPGGFRRYQMAISAVANIANTYSDSDGNQYITFPGSGFLGKGVANAMGLHGLMVGTVPPAQFGGTLSSASVIFPMSNGVTPDLGPLGSISAQGLTSMFEFLGKEPAFTKWTARPSNVALSALNALDGDQSAYNESILEQWIPNETLLRIVQLYEAAKLNGGGGQEGFNSAILQTYNMLAYMQNEATDKWEKDGEKGPAPQIVPTQQQALDNPRAAQQFAQRVKNTVVGYYITRAILGFVSPISAEVEPQDFGTSAELNDAITKAGSVAKGFDNFLAKDPNALPYTVADSFVPNAQGQPSGYSLSSSVPAQNWVVAHQADVDKYGPAYLWLMPQLTDAKYSATAYNEQVADGLRARETPEEHLDQLYIAAGNAIYYTNLDVFEDQLDKTGNDSTAKNALYDSWNSFITQMGQQYPIWYENYKSPDEYTNATQTISTLKQAFKDGAVPPGVQSEGINALLHSFDIASTQYNNAGAGLSYSNQQYQQSQVSDNWESYLETTANDYPNLKPVIQTVFMHALKAPS